MTSSEDPRQAPPVEKNSSDAGTERWEKDLVLEAALERDARRPRYCPVCAMPLNGNGGTGTCPGCGAIWPSSDLY